jgi:hypothetical protein
VPKFFLLKRTKTVEKTFKEKALEDKRIIKLFNMKDEGAYAINTGELIQELEDAHMARQFKSFKENEFLASAQRKLIQWTAEVERNRGRCITIKIQCVKIHSVLEQQIKAVKSYLLTKYREDLAAEHNTVGAKSEAVNSLLEPFNKLLKKLEVVIKVCDIVIDDLNKSHFSKESMIKILEMNYGRAS